MTDFYNQLGGFLWWILIKFCQTKLLDETSEINKVRNLLFISLFNFIFLFLLIYYLNNF